eukprot:6137234-Amphidinium_carterae.1
MSLLLATVSVHALMEPTEILAFVISNVKPCAAPDVEMMMVWIELKKRFEGTLTSFDHTKLDAFLRELIVQLHDDEKQ